MADRPSRILISGAGPTGLAAALALARYGIASLVIDKRCQDDGNSRFQAVVLDAQSVINLHALGVDTSFILPITDAAFIGDNRTAAGHVRYCDFPAHLDQPTDASLGPVLRRRKVVGMAAIAAIESGLRSACEAEPLIEINEGTRVIEFTPASRGFHIRCRGSAARRFDWLLAADGAHSDTDGILALAGIRKQDLAPSLGIIIAHLQVARPLTGRILIRNAPLTDQPYTAAFGLGHDVMLYTSGHCTDSRHHVEKAAYHLGLGGVRLAREPIPTRQRVRAAADIAPIPGLLVLGDAGYSGTAVLGVYLNKGISDALAAASVIAAPSQAVLDQRLRQFRRRQWDPALAQVTLEEQAVASLYNLTGSAPPAGDVSAAMSALAPRLAFRFKLQRRDLLTTALVNASDVAATTADLVARHAPSQTIASAASQGARFFDRTRRFLE